jgi:hypothetical protein
MEVRSQAEAAAIFQASRNKTFIRPEIKKRHGPKMFVSDGRVSQWVPDNRHQLIPTGTPGVVGRLVDLIRLPCPQFKERPWTPPLEYKLVASHMDKESCARYIKRCEDWFANHPITTNTKKPPQVSNINPEPVVKLFARYKGKLPPINEYLAVLKMAGYTDDKIAKVAAWWQKMEDTSEERQASLEALFAKYPGASKPIPKVKTARSKMIKVVKKKM